MARDVVLVLLGRGGLEHVALPHAGGHHHLRADGRQSPPALEAGLHDPQGAAATRGEQDTHNGPGAGGVRVPRGPGLSSVRPRAGTTGTHCWPRAIWCGRTQVLSPQLSNPQGSRGAYTWAEEGAAPADSASQPHCPQRGLPAAVSPPEGLAAAFGLQMMEAVVPGRVLPRPEEEGACRRSRGSGPRASLPSLSRTPLGDSWEGGHRELPAPRASSMANSRTHAVPASCAGV